MKRRALIAGIASGAAVPAQTRQDAATLYIPSAHRVEDLQLLHETLEEYPFMELVTAAPDLRITHLPVWLDRKAGESGTLHGHIARNNPQTAAIEAGAGATIVCKGPDAYISPTWYTNQRAVPTWNFASVHASGKLEPVTNPEALFELLATLVAKSEGKYGQGGYDFRALPRAYVDGMMPGIIGFRLKIGLLEGKFKLGQERSQADRESILRHLESAKPDRPLSSLTAAFYRRPKK